jgi:uncharacterized protein (DUF302 family)
LFRVSRCASPGLALTLGLALVALAPCATAAEDVVRHSAKGPFEDVRDAVVMAIEAQGLIVDHVAHVGAMLQRTAKDVGAVRELYGNADVLEFCSARISRAMMAADPHQIAFCPYSIAVYTLADAPGTVYVTYRRPPDAKGMADVRKLLADIVADALR